MAKLESVMSQQSAITISPYCLHDTKLPRHVAEDGICSSSKAAPKLDCATGVLLSWPQRTIRLLFADQSGHGVSLRGNGRDFSAASFHGSAAAARMNKQCGGQLFQLCNSVYELGFDIIHISNFAKPLHRSASAFHEVRHAG